MNFYYGLVDKATNAWGFVEETDQRVHKDMVYLTHDEWRALLKGQTNGLPICYYEGKVFNAESGRYYLDENGWHKRSEDEFKKLKADEKREYLINKLYEIKAEKAYGGVIINDLLVFETNTTSISNITGTLALLQDGQSTNWKFYTKDGIPKAKKITKEQLLQIAMFGRQMIDNCFRVEGEANDELEQATIENLIDEEWVENFERRITEEMNNVVNTLTLDIGA